jgi:hypothetical protein
MELTNVMDRAGMFRVRTEKWAAQAEQDTRAWVRRSNLVRSAPAGRHFDSITVGRLAARVYAGADTDRRSALADWLSWLFLFDDQVDEGEAGKRPERLAALLDSMLHPTHGESDACDNPLAIALRELWSRIQPQMPAAWCRRFTTHLAEYFQGCHWEAANRVARRVPSPVVFPAMRRAAGAVIPSLDLIEFAGGYVLPPQVSFHPLYLDLLHAAGDVICWTDDLFTVDKELARGDVHNLVIVLLRHERCSLDRASKRVQGLLEQRLDAFLDAQQQLTASMRSLDITHAEKAQVRRWLGGLRAWMRGHLDWGLETARYHEVEITTAPDAAPTYLENLLEVGAR